MARNIPNSIHFISEDDSDMPNSFNTTGTPDDSHSIMDNTTGTPDDSHSIMDNTTGTPDDSHAIMDSKWFIDLKSSIKYPRKHTIVDRYAATTPFNFWNLDREADSKTTMRSKVFLFDMRGKIKKSVKGKTVFIEAPLGVLKQRLASMNGVLQDQILLINVPENTITTITYAAILDGSIQNLTVFLKLDPEDPLSYRCINLPKDSGVEKLKDTLNLSQPSWPFLKGQRLQNTSSLVDQGVVSGDSIDLCKIRTEIVKCLFRAAPKYEQLFTVECLTIDSIFELKQKIRETIRNLNRTFNSISESVLNSHIWLTSGKRIYRDEEYICLLQSDLDYSSDSSDSRITTYYDYVLHFQPADCIPINVAYRVGDARFSTVETVFVPQQSSSTHLCEHISKLLNCLPTAVKLIIQGRKLPMNDDLSTFSEFKPGCEIHPIVKRAITVKVNMGDELLKFHVMKLDKVESLKCKIADKIKQLPRVLKLEFKGKELLDFNRIEQEDIKDNSTVNAEIVENRIQISIRKRKHPTTHFIVENVEATMIRDLKNYYRHVVRLSAKLDIDLYKYNPCTQLDELATLKAVGITDKEIIFASEKIFANVPYMKIYEASHKGNFTIKFGIVHNGVPFYSPVEPETVTEDSHENHAYLLPSTCCNIRIAQSFEVEPFEFSLSPEPLLHVQSPLPISPIPSYYGPVLPQQQTNPSLALVQTSQIIKQFSDMSVASNNTVMNRTTDGRNFILNTYRDPPEVISNKELQTLANELPGHNWQFFIRSLGILNAVVLRHTEAYPKNVAEAIYQCLNDWKQREGSNAKKCIIQKQLHSHGLRALSEQLFGYETN